MKKEISFLNELSVPPALASTPGRLANDAVTGDPEARERNELMSEFAEDLQALLQSFASLCEGLHAPELDHWNLSQRKVIDALEKAIRETATVVDQVSAEFAVPNQAQNACPHCIEKTTH